MRIWHKLLIISSIPLLIGGLVYSGFYFIQGPSSAETALHVSCESWHIPNDPEITAFSSQFGVRQQLRKLSETVDNPQFLQLMCFQLLKRDMLEKDLSTEMTIAEQAILYERIMGKLDRQEGKISPHGLDSILWVNLIEKDYLPSELRSAIKVYPDPQKAQFVIRAKAQNDQKAIWLANKLSQQLIDFYSKSVVDNLETTLSQLSHLRDQKRAEMDKKTEMLIMQQNFLRGEGADAVTRNLLVQIGTIELSRREEWQKIQVIKASIDKVQLPPRPSGIIQTRYRSDDYQQQLELELQNAHLRLSFLDAKLSKLRTKLYHHEAPLLRQFEEEVEAAQNRLILVIKKHQLVEKALDILPNQLKQITEAQSDQPNPYAPHWLAALAVLASFLFWINVLLKLRYLS